MALETAGGFSQAASGGKPERPQMTCGTKAVLIVTRSVTGTSTNVAQRRAELVCDAPAGHDGPHSDSRHTETWEGELGKVTTLLRHQG